MSPVLNVSLPNQYKTEYLIIEATIHIIHQILFIYLTVIKICKAVKIQIVQI